MKTIATLVVGSGLYGVTKLHWDDWPSRTWLSWVIAALFLCGAVALAYRLRWDAGAGVTWYKILARSALGVLIGLVCLRLALEATVEVVAPGQVPPWDRQLVDPWWTSIHTLTGLVLGIWLVRGWLVMILTSAWELLEVVVPGFGDEEINGNRMFDLFVAWLGWFVAAFVISRMLNTRVPFIGGASHRTRQELRAAVPKKSIHRA